MKRRGVSYDVGRVMWGQDWRPEFSLEEATRELQIIRDDMHCNAVRLCGLDLERLHAAGEVVLDLGLELWLSPELWDHSPAETLDYLTDAARGAGALLDRWPGKVVLSVGSEATLFMAGIVEGTTVFERLEHPQFWDRVRAGEHNGPLNAFLAEAVERVRASFAGPVTYASVPFETVDWGRFDVVSVDLYRDALHPRPVRQPAHSLLHPRATRRDHRVRLLHVSRRRGCGRQGLRHPRHLGGHPRQRHGATERPLRAGRIRASS